jgi:hypothetical protein
LSPRFFLALIVDLDGHAISWFRDAVAHNNDCALSTCLRRSRHTCHWMPMRSGKRALAPCIDVAQLTACTAGEFNQEAIPTDLNSRPACLAIWGPMIFVRSASS